MPATAAAPSRAAPCPPTAAKSTTRPATGPITDTPTSMSSGWRVDPITAWSAPAAGTPRSTPTTTWSGSRPQTWTPGKPASTITTAPNGSTAPSTTTIAKDQNPTATTRPGQDQNPTRPNRATTPRSRCVRHALYRWGQLTEVAAVEDHRSDVGVHRQRDDL